jgi:alkanesulfonate monooxygenase SsuD/methylene tetrahydromethanopterin reductase-like flavin-dependent oxidoreductase (luciferase family)
MTPWQHPLRIAAQAGMLSLRCEKRVNVTLGRGLTKLEWEAFDLPMSELRARFAERGLKF